jgi:hypothetical protein
LEDIGGVNRTKRIKSTGLVEKFTNSKKNGGLGFKDLHCLI